MTNVRLVGNCVKDADIRKTESGTVAVVTIASDRGRKSDHTDFIEVECWDLADAATLLVKGAFLKISGNIVTNAYEAKDGSKRKSFRIRARKVERYQQEAA